MRRKLPLTFRGKIQIRVNAFGNGRGCYDVHMNMDDELKIDAEIGAQVIAAMTSVSAEQFDSAAEILEEVKDRPDEGIDYLFGFCLGLVTMLSERFGVEFDEVVQVLALRVHLASEGVDVSELPNLNFLGNLPSEEAEEALEQAKAAFRKIANVASSAFQESAALPLDESDLLRGEALQVLVKLGGAHAEKIEKEQP